MAYTTKPRYKLPTPGYYYHYRHDPKKGVADYAYFIYGGGSHTEDYAKHPNKFFQIYQPLYKSFVYKNGKMFDVRPLHLFHKRQRYNGKLVKRFRRITDPKIIAQLRAIKIKMYPRSRYE